MAEQTVTVGVGALSIEDVIAVARGGAKVAISDESKHEMALSRAVIDHLADDTVPHYGISTGFGALASTSIPKEQRAQLQKSLIRSHAAGAGPEVEREGVRGLLVLRLSTLCTGRTGVRPETAQVYADMLNAGITPVVYEYGSLGCSGDLAPLAACALVAMGEGEARNADGLKIGGGEALRAAGITPVDLKEKEGLALVNEIRRRAGIPELPEGMSLAEFRKAVIQERALELAFEGNRLYDLRRTASVTATVPEATKLSEEQAAFYPIPQRELDLNPNVK